MRSPLLAGAVLIVAVLGLTWLTMTTSDDKFGGAESYLLIADFPDASGVRAKTRVQVAGIDVGRIEKIIHQQGDDGRLIARVFIRVVEETHPGVPLVIYGNASLRKAAESLLGDYRLDLNPGGPRSVCGEFDPCPVGYDCISGRCSNSCSTANDCASQSSCVSGRCEYLPMPKDGSGKILQIESVSDLDEIQAQLKVVARNVRRVSDSMGDVLGGVAGKETLQNIFGSVERSMGNIEEITGLMNQSLGRNDRRFDQIVRNIEDFSNAVRESVGSGGDVNTTARNMASLSGRLDDLASSLNDLMEASTSGEASVRGTLEEINRSMAHLAEVSRKIDEGEGTLGRMINDRTISDQVEDTLEDVGNFVGDLSRLETSVEWRSQLEIPFGQDNDEVQTAVKNIVALEIRPKPDKYYILEAVSDPRGKSTRVLKTESVNEGVPEKTETTTISFDELKFSAQFAKRFYFLTLRFGIIENTGGVGMNFSFFQDDLELRLDAFDFTRRDPDAQEKIFPRLRAAVMYELYNHIGLQLGIDDPLNDKLRTWFFGGVLSFTDEDLKTLFAIAPSP